MRRLLFVVALLSCGHSKASGPKWPEPSTTAEDGGESIAPRQSATYASVVEKTDEADEAKPAETEDKPAAAAAATEDKPATTTPASSQPTTEEVFTTEEIIIEIEE